MRVLVCGGRDYNNLVEFYTVMDSFTDIELLIHGAADGADAAAEWYGRHLDIAISRFPADWKKHKLAAGPIRNQKMLDEGKPDLVVAFPTPSSRGTWDMVRRAQKAGIETMIYKSTPLLTLDPVKMPKGL